MRELRIVSPAAKTQEEVLEIYGKTNHQELNFQGTLFGQNLQRKYESPDHERALEDFTQVYLNKYQQDSEGKRFIRAKKSEEKVNLLVNSNMLEAYMSENQNMTIAEEAQALGFHSYYNVKTNKEMQKKMGRQYLGESSAQKKTQSPKKKQMLSMSKIVKHSSSSKEVDQKAVKTRRKKSQGKINVISNHNLEESLKPGQKQQQEILRSSSQPQVRSLSQQADSQEKQVIQLKKQSIIGLAEQSNQQQIILKQENQKNIQIESSLDRNPQLFVTTNINSKTGSLKVLLKKNGSMKQMNGQQQNVKISKDHILLKNQNYNSQGSSTQQNQNIVRSRSLSNSNFIKKKQQTNLQSTVADPQILQDENITIRTIKKDKPQGVNLNLNLISTQPRCKSSAKSPQTSRDDNNAPPQQALAQNSSKVLMFKTNNEESNAKVAALKSIIKLSSNNNTSYMQTKGVSNIQQNGQAVRAQSKENISNLSQNQTQNTLQFNQIVQKFKMLENSQGNGGQFVQKCASANQNQVNKPQQQQQQYMQRITSSRLANQQNLNYHAQLKKQPKENQATQDLIISQTSKDKVDQSSNNFKNITQKSLNQPSQDKEASSSLKLASGQVNIRNIKVNSQNQQQQVRQQQDIADTTLAQISNNNKAQIIHQQKMHQILLNQQNRAAATILKGGVESIISKKVGGFSRNTQATVIGTCDEISMNISIKKGNSNEKNTTKKLIKVNSNGSNESINKRPSGLNETNLTKDQFSRKNSTLSNGSLGTQYTLQRDINSNFKSEQITKQTISNGINKNQNYIDLNKSQAQQSLLKVNDILTNDIFQMKNIPLLSENFPQNSSALQQQSGDKQRLTRINFYNQVSPTSDVLSQFKDSQMISPFKNNYEEDEEVCCIEDESMVIIQEDQLRIPLRSVKNSQQSQRPMLQLNEIGIEMDNPNEAFDIMLAQQPAESFQSDRSVFKKKHDNSVIEQDSLVNQIKTQLMKIHFQQIYQGESSKSKRPRNNQENNFRNKEQLNQSVLQSASFNFQPQFDDLSFEIDTCNQIKVPKNLAQPIDEVNILSLPHDCDIYQENIDPFTGKIRFTIDQKTVTIVNQNLKKNTLLRPENQVKEKSIDQFKDPLKDKLKQDYIDKLEENKEEDKIQKEIETTLNQIPSLLASNSLSMRTSLYSNTSHSLNTFLSEDISMNSNLIQQAFLAQGNQVAAGILSYAADKLNVREGDPLFLLPRLNEEKTQKLKVALLKREPEWWFGQELSTISQKRNEYEPILETFIF